MHLFYMEMIENTTIKGKIKLNILYIITFIHIHNKFLCEKLFT